jgi:Serine aminopeptidase, S33
MTPSPAAVATEKSTIVRSFKPPLRQRVALAVVGGLSRLAPSAAVRLAERLFLTPPRHPAPDRERDLLARARPGTVRVNGRRIATWTWGAGPRILLVHGWGGRGGQLGAFVEPLVARGFSVAWFDGPAHGASEGRRVTIPEMAAALRAVGGALGPVRGIVAHSGGGVVSAWAIRQWVRDGFVDLPEAIALVAPPADFQAHFERFARGCRLAVGARDRLQHRLERRVGEPLGAFDLPRFARDLPLTALVIHDREDVEVPWREGAAIAAAWPGAELLTTQGLGHRRILRDPAVVARVSTFLEGQLARRQSLAEEPSAVAVLG